MRASGTWAFSFRPKHKAIDRQGILATRKQCRHSHLCCLTARVQSFENIVFFQQPSLGQRASPCCEPLEVTPKLHFFGKQRISRDPVRSAFAWKLQVLERLKVSHSTNAHDITAPYRY